MNDELDNIINNHRRVKPAYVSPMAVTLTICESNEDRN